MGKLITYKIFIIFQVVRFKRIDLILKLVLKMRNTKY